MLSEQESQELLAMAASEDLREDFRQLRLGSRSAGLSGLDLDEYIRFLSAFHRLFPPKLTPRRPVEYKKVLL